MKQFWLQLRFTWSWGMALPPVLLLVFSLFTVYSMLAWHEGDFTPAIMPLYEAVVPLMAIFMFPRLVAGEAEAGRLELMFSYPRPRWQHLLTGIAGILVILAIALAGVTTFYALHADISVQKLLLHGLVPLLPLAGLSLLVSTLFNSSITGYLAAGSWWFLDFLTQGAYGGPLFLFAASMPDPELDFALNRWGLAGLGILFFALTFIALQRKQQYR